MQVLTCVSAIFNLTCATPVVWINNSSFMDAFALVSPEWTKSAVHAVKFCCPTCKANPTKAKNVWLNRRAPVSIGNQRKYQEFYLCECDTAWWGWSNDRPPSPLRDK